MNDVSLWANNIQMSWIMKITKRLQEAPKAAREELVVEIQRSAETDACEDPAEDEQADNVTSGHKMMYPAEPN